MLKAAPRTRIVPGFAIARVEAGAPARPAASYSVGAARVWVTREGRYLVSEPALSGEAEKVWRGLMENLYYSYSGGGGARPVIESLEAEAREAGVHGAYAREREAIEYYVARDVEGYRELDVPMRDPRVEDVICTRHDREAAVIHRDFQEEQMLKTNIRFPTRESFDGLLQVMAQRNGHAPTTARPVLCCSAPDNSRITITWGGEVSRPGSTLAVRKFPEHPYTVPDLLRGGTMTPLLAAYVWLMNDARAFSLVIGETGAGKTTLMNALACMSNPRWHVLAIEEVRELSLPHFWAEYLVTRQSPQLAKSEYDIGIMDLGMAAMRKKPHSVIVGEVRGPEARQLFQVALTGHGCTSSVHASGPAELLARLGGEGMGVPGAQISAIDYIVHAGRARLPGGRLARRVLGVSEIEPGGGALREVFRYDPASDSLLPGSAAELARASSRLGRAARFLGIGNIAADLEKRAAVMEGCPGDGGMAGVFAAASRYYGISDPASA